MSFTSMTDAQRQVHYGYDKKPWVDRYGERKATHDESERGEEFAPRPECIPSPDPRPFIGEYGYRWPAWRHNHGVYCSCEFKPRPWGSFTPDPELVRSPVNPILSAFRGDRYMDLEATLDHTNLEWMTDFDATPEQVADARKVLTRLASIAKLTELLTQLSASE